MRTRPYRWLATFILLGAALVFRIFVIFNFPEGNSGDGPTYTQLARNLFERKIYSVDSQPPYRPTAIRTPGYPLFLAPIYFAGYHDGAVRVAQAVLDTATCALVALLAFNWAPDRKRKWAAALAALAFAGACPFTAVYVRMILTETLTTFLATTMGLAATYAIKAQFVNRSVIWWAIAGALGGMAVLVRPDAGLYTAELGLIVLVTGLSETRGGVAPQTDGGGSVRDSLLRTFLWCAALSFAFLTVLTPWVIRNARVFHRFQPLSPSRLVLAEGYYRWLRTWVDDNRYVAPLMWSLYDDQETITIDQIPERVFDSAEERARVEALLGQLNHTKMEDIQDEGVELLKMPSFIDAGFAEIAAERIARAPLRYYLWLPAKRAAALWFDTHSEYYPFQGELFPLADLNRKSHQQVWLPVFAALLWAYTLLGAAGAYQLWRAGEPFARRWLLLAALFTLPRLAFFSTIECPEPRYVVELFPFVSVLCGIAMSNFVFKVMYRLHVAPRISD